MPLYKNVVFSIIGWNKLLINFRKLSVEYSCFPCSTIYRTSSPLEWMPDCFVLLLDVLRWELKIPYLIQMKVNVMLIVISVWDYWYSKWTIFHNCLYIPVLVQGLVMERICPKLRCPIFNHSFPQYINCEVNIRKTENMYQNCKIVASNTLHKIISNIRRAIHNRHKLFSDQMPLERNKVIGRQTTAVSTRSLTGTFQIIKTFSVLKNTTPVSYESGFGFSSKVTLLF